MKLNLCKNSPHDEKTCFSLHKIDFLRGGEISPPLGPWCKKKTLDPEGLSKKIDDFLVP